MRLQWLRFEFRVELAPEVPRVVRDFANLYVHAVHRLAGDPEAVARQHLLEFAIELVAVPVPLADLRCAVGLTGEAPFLQLADVRSQAHRAAEFVHTLQLT